MRLPSLATLALAAAAVLAGCPAEDEGTPAPEAAAGPSAGAAGATAAAASPSARTSAAAVVDPDPTPPAPPRPPLDLAIERAIRDAFVDAARKAVETPGYPRAAVLTDDTPRVEILDDTPEGEVLTFLPGASCRVPLAGLERVGVSAASEGLELRLGYGAHDVVVRDLTGTPLAKALLERLRETGALAEPDLWPDVTRRVLAWAADEGATPEAAVRRRLDDYRPSLARFDRRFREEARRLGVLRERALRATVERVAAAADLGDAYRAARLLGVKAQVVAAAGGAPGLRAEAVAAGPVTGVRRGVPAEDGEAHYALDGPDGMTFEVHLVPRDAPAPEGARAGAGGVTATAAAISRAPRAPAGAFAVAACRTVAGSFRPYAPERGRAQGFDRRAADLEVCGAPGDLRAAALLRVAAYHLFPDVAHAESLLRALSKLEPRPAPAELSSIADRLAESLRLNSRGVEHLQAVTREAAPKK